MDNFKLVWGTLEDEYDRALRKSELDPALGLKENEDELLRRFQDLKAPGGAVPENNL